MKKVGIIAVLSVICALSIQASAAIDVKVDTFNTNPVTLTACEDVPGSGSATFNLTGAEADLVDLLPNMLINWYVDAALSTSILTPSAYISSSSTVYAQVLSTLDTICKTTQEVTLIVLSAPNLAYLESIQDTFCGRPTVQFGDMQGPDATYVWTPADFLSSDTISNPIFTPDPDIDTYSYQVTATSPNGACQTTATVEFTVLTAELEIQGADTIEFCKGSARATIAANTLESPENIMWSSSRDTLTRLTGIETGIDAEYSTFIYAKQLYANGCLMRDTVFIRVDSLPKFDISVIPDPMEPCQKYCPGTTVTLVTNAPDLACYPDIEYFWTPSSASGGDIVGSDTTLNVALALSNANTRLYERRTINHACIEIDSHIIRVVDTIIDINGLPMGRVCRGYQFTAMIDTSDLKNLTEINWINSFEDRITLSCDDCPNPIVTIADDAMAGSVSISVEGIAELCCPASGILMFNIAVPIVPVMPLQVCVGGSGQIIGDPTFTDYSWTNVSGGVLSADNISNPIISDIQEGGATMMVNAIAPDGCPSEGTFMVTAFFADPPQVSAPNSCEEGSSQIINTSTGFTDYVWTRVAGDADISDANSAAPLITNLGPNGVTYTLTATDANGCDTRTSLTISAENAAPPMISAPPTCLGGSSQIIADPSFTNYQWVITSGTGNISDAGIFNPLITNIDQQGGVILSVSANDANGCLTMTTVVITIDAVPILKITATDACLEGSSQIQIVDGGLLSNIQWSTPSSGTLSSTSVADPMLTGITGLGNIVLNVTATDQGGCAREGQVTIIVNDGMGLTLTPTMVCPETPVPVDLSTVYQFNADDFSADTANVTFEINDNILTISKTPKNEFWVFFTANSIPENCLVRDSFLVTFIDIRLCGYYMPNAFAPLDNERTENNTFQPLDSKLGNPFPASRIDDFVIYNRWGQKVYDNDSNDTGWDGKQNGELAPSDVYIYIIKYNNPDGTPGSDTGDVTLIR